MTTGTVSTIGIAALAAASLAATVLHRALSSASLARLEEINQEEGRYGELPDMRGARLVAGGLKLLFFVAFVALVAREFVAASPGAGAYVAAFAVALGSLFAMEAIALVAFGHHSGRMLYRMMPLVSAFATAGEALLALGRAPAAFVALLIGREAPPPHDESVEEDILDAVSEGEREGVIEDEEREMIESIIEFKDSEVAAVMTPRTELVIVREDMMMREALNIAIDSAHSRLPVAAETADNIVGILHVKDLLPHIGTPGESSMRVREIMRAPYFVPETKRVRELLQEFRATNIHMAIVLDEYGGTSGIVTIEDILEEIVGEIADEYEEYQPPEIRVTAPSRAVVAATAPVSDVNEALGTSIPKAEEYETIAGFVLYRTGRIPKSGETVDLDNVRFRVLDADERRIKRMALSVVEEGAAGAAAQRK